MYELSVGSKVFLLGEYQVLQGGAAFLTVLEPRFRMRITRGNGKLSGINVGSPAQRYFESEKQFLSGWDFEFLDPHAGQGGFGASTAQIALLQGFREGFQSLQTQAQLDLDLGKIHKTYLQFASSKTGVPPSGADLVSQFQGGLLEVDLGKGKLQRHAWPFPQWQVLFFSTGHKLATHEHLIELKDVETSSLRILYQQAMDAFRENQPLAFVEAFRQYQKMLAIKGWQAENTTRILGSIEKADGVVAAKGCGAMGADVIAVIVEIKEIHSVIAIAKSSGLKYSGSLEDRTEGFAWTWVPETSLLANSEDVQWI